MRTVLVKIAKMETPLQFIPAACPLKPPLYQFVFSQFTPSLPLASFHPLPQPSPCLSFAPNRSSSSAGHRSSRVGFLHAADVTGTTMRACMCVCAEEMIHLFFHPPPLPVAHFPSHKGLNLSEMSGVLTNSQLLAICSRAKAHLHDNRSVNRC